MENAKNEFLRHVEDKPKVKCAYMANFDFDYSYRSDDAESWSLKLNYTEDDFNKFISSIDFEYHDGYGGQELFGTIWYEGGTFSSRGEYDGSEWWDYWKCPSIPDELK